MDYLKISGLLILSGVSLLVAMGNIALTYNQTELLGSTIIITSVMILFGGLQCWLVPRKFANKPASVVGWRVCGLVTLLIYALVSLLMLYLVFYHLMVNAPFRVDFEAVEFGDGDIHYGTLENGMRYTIARTDFQRHKFSIALHLDVGSYEERENELGLAHLAEHMILHSILKDKKYNKMSAVEYFEKLGATIRSHTSHRSTITRLLNIPYDEKNVIEIFNVLENIFLVQDHIDKKILQRVKLIIAGEERVMNSTHAVLRRRVFCNHFGFNSRFCIRFPYGRDQGVNKLDEKSLYHWYAKWYHPARFQLYIAGDFSVNRMIKLIKSSWKSIKRKDKTEVRHYHTGFIPPRPSSPFLIETISGVDGLDVNLIVTTPYHDGPRTANFHRIQTLNRIFYGVLLNQFMYRMLAYDYTRSELHDNVKLDIDVDNAYEFDQTIHSIHLKICNHPEHGDWRRYMEVFLMELRRLATHGPDLKVLRNLMTTADRVLEARRAFSSFEDSGKLTIKMLDNADPELLFLNPVQRYSIESPFLNNGFRSLAANHIQGEAQFLWKALVQLVNNSQPFIYPPYNEIKDGAASFTILTDKIDAPRIVKDINMKHLSYSYVTKQKIRMLMKKVLNAVLLPLKIPLVIVSSDVFLRSHTWSHGWDKTGEVDKSIHNHVKLLHERVAAHDSLNLVLDGLPEYHSLVNIKRLQKQSEYVDLSVTTTKGPLRQSKEVHKKPKYHESSSKSSSAVIHHNDDDGDISDTKPHKVKESEHQKLVEKKQKKTTIKKHKKELPSRPFALNISHSQEIHDPLLTPIEEIQRASEYELIDSFPLSGIQRYRLSNGLRVNLKKRLSGIDHLPCDAPGIVELEVVSLGGRSTQPTHLKGACEFINLDVPSGHIVEYWSDDSRDQHQALLGILADNKRVEQIHFDVHAVDMYLNSMAGGRPRMICGMEHFRIRKQLHAQCVNYPNVQHCNKRRFDYTKRLEAIRLAMSPVFDDNSIVQGASKFKRILSIAKTKSDPNDFMRWRTYWDLNRKWMNMHRSMKNNTNNNNNNQNNNNNNNQKKKNQNNNNNNKKKKNDDSRSQIVSTADIAALDPVEVGLWIREQFTLDRMEVNVVGDFEEHTLLHQLNLMLGTMPLSRHHHIVSESHKVEQHHFSPRSRHRVGHDIYDPNHESSFKMNFNQYIKPKSSLKIGHKLIHNCTLPGLHPGRAYIAMSVLLNADFTSIRGHQKALLTESVFKQKLLNVLSRDAGYVYSVTGKMHISQIYHRFGYFQLQWVVGVDNGKQKELKGSLHAIERILNSTEPFDNDTFIQAKAQTISQLESRLQHSETWLPIMMGISLAPPVWRRKQNRTQVPAEAMYDTLSDLSQTDVLGCVKRLTLSDVQQFFTQYLASYPAHVAVVETTSLNTKESDKKIKDIFKGPPCEWQT